MTIDYVFIGILSWMGTWYSWSIQTHSRMPDGIFYINYRYIVWSTEYNVFNTSILYSVLIIKLIYVILEGICNEMSYNNLKSWFLIGKFPMNYVNKCPTPPPSISRYQPLLYLESHSPLLVKWYCYKHLWFISLTI